MGRHAIAHCQTEREGALGCVRGFLRRLLWLSLGLKGLALMFAALDSEPQWSFGLLLSFCGVLVEFYCLYAWLYPLERRLRQLELSKWEYLRLRLGSVYERLAPLVAAGLGVLSASYLARGQHREDGLWGMLYALLSVVGALLLGVMVARVRRLPPSRTVPLCEGVQSELRRLAQMLHIPVPELVVVDGRRMRQANAFALPGGQIAITDYLVAHLSERELLAVLAHEVAHLAQRPRLVRLWLAVAGFGVVVSVGIALLGNPLPEWSLLAVMGGLAGMMSLPMVWLRAYHEREADAFAVSEYGVDALRSALLKTATLNQRQPHRKTDSVHMGLNQRLRWLERFTQV